VVHSGEWRSDQPVAAKATKRKREAKPDTAVAHFGPQEARWASSSSSSSSSTHLPTPNHLLHTSFTPPLPPSPTASATASTSSSSS